MLISCKTVHICSYILPKCSSKHSYLRRSKTFTTITVVICTDYFFFSSALVQQFQGMMETFKALKPSQEKCHPISSLKSDIVIPKQEHIVEQSLGPLQKMPTPLPVDQVDYPDAVYWTQQSWQDYSQQREQKGEKVKKLGFICTEDGEFVGAVRIKTMTETAKKLWNHLHHHWLAPATWRLISQDAYDYFSNHMCAIYPEFRLCEGDWKAKIFGTIRYPDWSHGSRASGKLTRLYLVFLIFCLTFFVSGAIPSIDTHTGSGLSSGQSKDIRARKDDSAKSSGKRARKDESTKNSDKRHRTQAFTSVKPTDIFDSSGAADIIDGHSSSSSVHSSTSSLAIVAAKPQLKPRLLHTPRPSSAYLNIYSHYQSITNLLFQICCRMNQKSRLGLCSSQHQRQRALCQCQQPLTHQILCQWHPAPYRQLSTLKLARSPPSPQSHLSPTISWNLEPRKLESRSWSFRENWK
jgi:hypothetical protein